MNTLRLSTLILLALALALPARAGEEERKASVELVHLVLPRTSYLRMMDQMSHQVLASVKTKDGAPMPAELVEKVSLAVQDALPYEEMVGWTADIYQSRFTLDELHDIIAFYRTPAGLKVARLLPEITAAMGKRVGEVMPERLPPAMRRRGLGAPE